jgi:hypothetical protein
MSIGLLSKNLGVPRLAEDWQGEYFAFSPENRPQEKHIATEQLVDLGTVIILRLCPRLEASTLQCYKRNKTIKNPASSCKKV